MQADVSKRRVAVLGAGRVGGIIAAELARDPALAVHVVDRELASQVVALRGVTSVQADLSDPQLVVRHTEGADVVVGALPSAMGWAVLETLVAHGRRCCDISFMPEDPLVLDTRARETGATVVVDCGVAPGLTHMLVGHAAALLERTERVLIYVGGLPVERSWPFRYKAPFAPGDVIEEYTRPVRVVEGGQVVVREALSEIERLDFDGVGQLEAFNTDGLRSLVATVDAAQLQEKTLRYPGHADLMRVLRHIGLFSRDPVTIANGTQVRPLDLTQALLFPHWQYSSGEADLTVMRVIVEGRQGRDRLRYRWDLLDRYDPTTGWSSMARVTGFPAAIVARWLASGELQGCGVIAPERLMGDGTRLPRMLEELERRGVKLTSSVEVVREIA